MLIKGSVAQPNCKITTKTPANARVSRTPNFRVVSNVNVHRSRTPLGFSNIRSKAQVVAFNQPPTHNPVAQRIVDTNGRVVADSGHFKSQMRRPLVTRPLMSSNSQIQPMHRVSYKQPDYNIKSTTQLKAHSDHIPESIDRTNIR